MTGNHDWAGGVGDAWAAEWQRTDRSFADMARHLDAAILAAATDGGFAVDIGCGAGATSITLARARPDVRVTGIDLSSALIDIARSRATGMSNLDFAVSDAAALATAAVPFDLLVSRHGVMFFDDPLSGLAALRTAASPDAALVFSCFRSPALNGWAAETIEAITGQPPVPANSYVPGPFAFADPGFVTTTLQAAGWAEITHQPVDFSYRAGAGDDPVADAVDFFTHIGPAAPLLRAAEPAQRAAMIDRLAAMAKRHLRDGAVDFPAAAWLWSARAGEATS